MDRLITDLLLPARCARCNCDLPVSGRILLCTDCEDRLIAGQDFCRRCGVTCLGEIEGTGPCPRCRGAKFQFDSVIPLGPYRDALRDAILWMKHPGAEGLSTAMARLLVTRREGVLREFKADCIIPIPMYWGRRIRRGVNSSEVLAEELSRQIDVPVLARALCRSRNTLPQRDLGHAERFRNVRGAFALNGGYVLQDARVLVIDDIMTTGATCSEAAKTLKKGGAGAVSAVVAGRAVVGE